jgi:hypothetical protein
MSAPALFQSRTGRRLRAVLRWGRVALLFAVFLAVAAVAYLHLIGLPDFAKQALLHHLRERGLEAQFTGARLGWGPEVVVDNAAFHRSDRPLGPRLAAGQARVHLDPAKLLRRRLSADALRISQGSLKLPMSEAAGDFLFVNDIDLDLVLLPNDTIRLQDGHASFHGIPIALRGAVTNFMAARDWNLWPAAAGAGPTPALERAPQDSLRRFAAALDGIHFPAPPRLDLNLTADGRDPDTLRVKLALQSGGVQTPWGEAAGLNLEAECARPANPGSAPFVTARLRAGAFAAPQAQGKNLDLTAGISRAAGSNWQAAIHFAVSNFKGRRPGPAATNALEAASLRWNGSVTLQPSPLALAAASGNGQADQVVTPWGSAGSATLAWNAAAVEGSPAAGVSRGFWAKINRWALDGQAVRVATLWGSADSAALTWNAAAVEGSPAADDSWGLWAKVNRWSLDWQADLSRVATTNIQMDRFRCAGSWRAPELVLTNVEAVLYSGGLSGRARLDVASRELEAGARFDFEAHRLAPLLPPAVQTRLNQIQWERPPQAAFEARVALPPWTNRPPGWAARLLPSLQLTGDFSVGASSFGGMALDSAQSRFAYSNRVWNIPRLHLAQPGGEAYVDFTGNGETGGFLFIIDSHLDPGGLRPLLPERQQPLLGQAAFSKADPPRIHAEIRGCREEPATLAVQARLTATNFTARGEKVDGLEATVEYTNSLARLRDVRVFKDGGELAAPLAEMDWTAKKISLSNAVSTLDPRMAARLLGARAPAWLRVIGFDTPPVIHAGGSFVLNDPMATDLRFAISGRNFRYSKLLAGTASGEVHWTGQKVALTNVQAGLYDGTLRGWCFFDDEPETGTDFRGQASLAKIELPLLVQGWGAKSNRLEGVLEGNMALTSGNTANNKSWTGSGRLSVAHALLWDIRLFGIFSPMLNKIILGAGDSRAYQAGMDFVVTNGMVATDNLEIRSTDFRLLYRGTLNTEKELDARVEAKVLRDFPIFGRVFSFAISPLSRLFEYKVGGTLDAPTRQLLALTLIREPFHNKSPPPADDSPAPGQPAP